MKQSVIVLGGGGHAKVLIDALLNQNVSIIGYTDQNPEKIGKKVFDVSCLGDDQIIFGYSADSIRLVNGIGSIATTDLRKMLFQKFKDRNYSFLNVIHSSAVIASDVILSEGVEVMAGAIIQTGCEIGNNSIINTKASVDHDCRIGSHVHIAPGVTLSGGVTVEDGVHIGAGATIIQGVKIGRNSIIGAGAVVISDVPENVTAVGVPAKEVL